jgi:hypothetical protein
MVSYIRDYSSADPGAAPYSIEMDDAKPRTFSRAVFAQWQRTVTGEHSARYLVAGLVLAIIIPVLAWDQTSNIWGKVFCAAGVPGLLLITSIISANRKEWITERQERDKLEQEILPKIRDFRKWKWSNGRKGSKRDTAK